MKMGSDNEFICLIPPARDTPMSPHENIDHDAILSNAWSLLEPLSGKCLYVRPFTFYRPTIHHSNSFWQHRQPWFTYSYCHNREIRQFKELAHTQPRPPGNLFPILWCMIRSPISYPGTYEPTEDPEVCAILLRQCFLSHCLVGIIYSRTCPFRTRPGSRRSYHESSRPGCQP